MIMQEVIQYKPKNRRLLIDGDILVHMACWQKPASKADLEEMEWRGASLKEIEAAKQTYQPSIEHAQDRFEHFVEHIFESHYIPEEKAVYSMAVGNSQDNFRKKIHPEYKLQKARATSNKKRAPYIDELRFWAVDVFDAHYCQGYEADDAIGVWATKLGEDNYVVVTVDKDLDMIPGYHLDPKTEVNAKRRWHVNEEQADIFFWKQMLTGDSIDNIPGIEGIGPIKAGKILSGLTTPQEHKEVVVSKYGLKYGNEGFKKLLFNGSLLHIWRTKGDIWTFDPEEYEEITNSHAVIV